MRSAIATVSAPSRPSEDFVAATDDLVIVLDGATTPGHLDTGCTHGTRWFARTLGVEIFTQLAPRPGIPLAEGLADAIAAVAEKHGQTCDTSHPGHPSATVAILRESAETYDYLVLADSTVAINTAAGIEAITDDRLDTVATEYHHALRSAPQGTDEHATAFGNLTTALRRHRNQAGGFWVAAIDPEAAHQALAGSVERSKVISAAVLSDGASIIVDRFHLMEWPAAFELLASAGPSGLIDKVRKAELSDATGERWPRGKVHDDATAVYCEPSS